jgi:hypothetical protein
MPQDVPPSDEPRQRILDPSVEEVTMFWLPVLLGLVFVVYLLSRWAKRADDIEDDSAYLYENAQGPGYGSRFLNILRGRPEDD